MHSTTAVTTDINKIKHDLVECSIANISLRYLIFIHRII